MGAISVDPNNRIVLGQTPTDPRFSEPISGLYWQVSSDRGDMLRSRSLWDTTLALPADEPSPGEMHLHEADGPGRSRVLIAERQIRLTISDQRVALRVAAAADLARVTTAASAFRA